MCVHMHTYKLATCHVWRSEEAILFLLQWVPGNTQAVRQYFPMSHLTDPRFNFFRSSQTPEKRSIIPSPLAKHKVFLMVFPYDFNV